MTDITQDPEYIASLQRYADAEHARQPVCSWDGRPGIPYEYNGIKWDGLTACSGDRLCSRCVDSYLENTPRLMLEFNYVEADTGNVHWYERDLNRKTRPGGAEGTGFVRHVVTTDMSAKQVVRTDTPLYQW
jgi:hypothetical protein